MKSAVRILLIIFLSGLALFITTKLIPSSKHRYESGKLFARDIEEVMPKCWTPAKKFLLDLGCSALSSDAQPELAILLTSCLLETKNLKPVTCNSADFTLCRRGKCLFNCGMANGERAIGAVGYNPFKRVHDALPDLCSYFMRYESFELAHVNWTEFAQDISSQTRKPNMAAINSFQPGYPTLRDLFFERIQHHRRRSKVIGDVGTYLEDLALTPRGFGILLIVDILLCFLIIAVF